MINFTNIMNNPKWMKILYANTRIDIKDDLKVINELEQIDDLIIIVYLIVYLYTIKYFFNKCLSNDRNAVVHFGEQDVDGGGTNY